MVVAVELCRDGCVSQFSTFLPLLCSLCTPCLCGARISSFRRRIEHSRCRIRGIPGLRSGKDSARNSGARGRGGSDYGCGNQWGPERGICSQHSRFRAAVRASILAVCGGIQAEKLRTTERDDNGGGSRGGWWTVTEGRVGNDGQDGRGRERPRSRSRCTPGAWAFTEGRSRKADYDTELLIGRFMAAHAQCTSRFRSHRSSPIDDSDSISRAA